MPGVQIEKTCCNIIEAEIDQYDPQFTYETVELFSCKIRITPNNKLNKNIEYIFIDRKIEKTSRKCFCKFANKP